MDVEKISWIVVRAIGIYFAAQLFNSLSHIGVTVAALIKFYGMQDSIPQAEASIIRTWFDIAYILVEISIFAFLSYYCLRKGEFVQKLLVYRKNDEHT